MMHRLRLAILIGLIVASARLLVTLPSDLYWPHCAARALLALSDPYGAACVSLRSDGVPWVVNPLTSALILLPLTPLPLDLATAIVLGLSSSLMAWGLLEGGLTFRLLIFFSAPFVSTLYYGQWAALILAVALTPAWLPLVLVKPHVGLPAFLTRLTRTRLLGTAVFGLISLLVMPAWPLEWLHTLGTYDGYSVLLVAPWLALLALRWRDEDARYLLLCAIVPSRGIYDALITGAVLRSRVQILVWVVAGWLPFLVFRNADLFATIATYTATAALVLIPSTAPRLHRPLRSQ
jgi:hypothetical protein